MNTVNKDFGTIGILMGGYSSEREISLRSGGAVSEALSGAGYKIKPLDITVNDEKKIRDLIAAQTIDVAFIALHGKLGEDGTIQRILEELKIPYTGSGVEASRLALNKTLTQALLKMNRVPVPDFAVLYRDQSDIGAADQLIQKFGFPLVVKPACEGSSIGITVAREKKEFEVALNAAFGYGNEVLVERFIEGRELTVGILGDTPLPVIEIVPKNKFFDFKSKYEKGMTEYLIPAPLQEETASKVQKVAYAAHQTLGCRDVSRVDVMLDNLDQLYVLEVNTIPGFTSTSLLPKAAKAAHLDFVGLCCKLIELAYEKKR